MRWAAPDRYDGRWQLYRVERGAADPCRSCLPAVAVEECDTVCVVDCACSIEFVSIGYSCLSELDSGALSPSDVLFSAVSILVGVWSPGCVIETSLVADLVIDEAWCAYVGEEACPCSGPAGLVIHLSTFGSVWGT